MPAIKIENKTASRWVDIDENTFSEDLEEIAASLGEDWRVSQFQGFPAFLCQARPDFDQLIDFAQSLEECQEVFFPESIYTSFCQSQEAVVAPSRIALFGDGEVATDADIALAVAEATGESVPDPEKEGALLRQDGCLVIEGFVAQYI